MRILFVGTKMQGYFIEEECLARKWTIDYVETTENMDLLNYENDILVAAMNGYDYVVYDTTSCITDAETIAYFIEKNRKSNGMKPIIVVTTLNAKNAIVSACINQNLSSFISKGSGTASDYKEQFIKIVTRYYENVGREELEKVENVVSKSLEKVKNTRTIGVAGTCRRIGTSTQAIQIAKYLKYKGYRACIIEMNSLMYPNTRSWINGEASELSYFEKIRTFLELKTVDKPFGYIQVEGVDIYYKPEKLKEICEKGYDFQIFDYGVYSGNAFNKAAFLKDDTQIFVGGADAAEIDYVCDILDNTAYKDSKIIFSFVNEQNREEIKSIFMEMKKSTQDCFFAEYTPDPYVLSNVEMFDRLFQLEDKKDETQAEESKKKKRKGLFGRK